MSTGPKIDSSPVESSAVSSPADSPVEIPKTTIEEIFQSVEVPSWRDQLTIRGFVVSAILSVSLTFVAMKINLTTGLVPSLNTLAALLGYSLVKVWIKLLLKLGRASRPFTRQENVIIEACITASLGVAWSGGFGTYLTAMTRGVAKQVGEDGKTNVKNIDVAWVIPFLFVVSYVGPVINLIFRKLMIQKYKLAYPSGTATANLINSFHTPEGTTSNLSSKQTRWCLWSSAISFTASVLKWPLSGGKGCGFNNYPIFGLAAYKQKLYYDASLTYVGIGMISPPIVTISFFIGAILSCAILWPIIQGKKGQWYDAKLSDNSFHGLQGYKASISIALLLGDMSYKIVRLVYHFIIEWVHDRVSSSDTLLHRRGHLEVLTYDDERRIEFFRKDPIPSWLSALLYSLVAFISFLLLPAIFRFFHWYHLLFLYALAPLFGFCNAYGCGVSDWSLAASFGRLVIFIIASWAGADHGGIVTSLAACGVITNIVSTAADSMQDLKAGYLTLSSPLSLFISQMIGTTIGCLSSSLVYWLFSVAVPDIGEGGSEYPAPTALVYRNMATLGVEGPGALPDYCVTFIICSFVAAVVINGVRDVAEYYEQGWAAYVPHPTPLAIPFYVGGSFTIDMCVGSLGCYLWRRRDRASAESYSQVVASGLMCGEGLATLPNAILGIAKIKPPMCMDFIKRRP